MQGLKGWDPGKRSHLKGEEPPVIFFIQQKGFRVAFRSSVGFVSFHHGVPWPGPESAEGDGAAHQPHLQILAK